MMRKMVFITLAVGIVFQFYFALQGPEQVAIHFNIEGQPDSWASSNTALTIGIIAYMVITAIFLMCSRVISSIPVEKMNIPNKEYWMNPARQPELKKAYELWFEKLIVGSNLFLMVVFYILYKANDLAEPKIDLNVLFILLGIYIGWTTWLCIDFFMKFKNPKSN